LPSREPCAHADAFGGVPTLGYRGAERVQVRERPALGVRNEQADVLEAIGEELGNSRLELVEGFACNGGDLEGARERVSEPSTSERIEAVGLVQDELDGDVVCADLTQNGLNRGDRLAEPSLGE